MKSKLLESAKKGALGLALALALTCGLAPAAFAAEESALDIPDEIDGLVPLSSGDDDHYHAFDSTGYCAICNYYSEIADFIDLQIPGALFALFCEEEDFGTADSIFIPWKVTSEGLVYEGGNYSRWTGSDLFIYVVSPTPWSVTFNIHDIYGNTRHEVQFNNQVLFRDSFVHDRYPRLTYSVSYAESEQSFSITTASAPREFPKMVIPSITISYAKCGDNVNWSFDNKTGKLSIWGSGPMWDYSTMWDKCRHSPAWSSYVFDINSAEIAEGVTSLCDYAFTMSNIESIDIPDDIPCIGEGAFEYCSNLQSIRIPASIKSIKQQAFYGVDELTDVYYLGTAADFAKIDIKEEPFAGANIHFHDRCGWEDAPGQPATCTEGGIEVKKCQQCAITHTATTPALGHNYSGGVCTRCGKVQPADPREDALFLENATVSFSDGGAYSWIRDEQNNTLAPTNIEATGTTAEATITINTQKNGSLSFQWSCVADDDWYYSEPGALTVLLDGQEIMYSPDESWYYDYCTESISAGEHKLTLRYESQHFFENAEVFVGPIRVLTEHDAGDVNANGLVNIVDAQLAYDIACGGLRGNTDFSRMYAYADMACDGVVDAADAFAIQHWALTRN